MELKDKLKRVPQLPGVYFFRNARGTIIYIGKARILRNRVRSYFQNTKSKDSKTRLLVKNIADLEWLVVRDEVEALLTEANLIREHRPRFNISLKDDKTFPYIQITAEPFPRVKIIRMKNIPRDGSTYFGPYTEVKRLRATMRALHNVFPLRSCDYLIDAESIAAGKIKLCLDYHIKRCEGPCEGLVSQEHYEEMIRQVIRFLRGRSDQLRSYLVSEMERASADLRFEDALRFRNQLDAVENFTRKQKKVTADFTDRDVLVVASENTYGTGVVLRVRNGFYLGREKFDLKIVEGTPAAEIVSRFLHQYYSATEDIPKEILLEMEIEDLKVVETWLQGRKGSKVTLLVPQKGEKKKLVRICRSNADLLLGEIRLRKLKRRELLPKPVTILQEDLGLAVPPRRIEAFDNSNIQGTHPVASMVCFIDGKPRKSEYRKFNIKTVTGPDDFESMYEVVKRRYSRVKRENGPLPDLILIDGGKGQLRFAYRALQELKLEYLSVIGLAKRLEEVYKPGMSEPQNIPKTSPGLFLLRKIRDEAHRFAISFHREKRAGAMTRSALEEVSGLGKKRIQRIWKEYNSLAELKNAAAEEISMKAGVPMKVAVALCQKLAEKYSADSKGVS
ncbi:MAG: excinuclease ABC subunit C [FCB group bacterium]|nr:excinuclease ABC subunit C [FCB group bacterium]